MMLPGAVPAVLKRAHGSGGVGVAVYALYRPHGSFAAHVVVIAAGVYEFTPLKQYFRRRCREGVRSGFEFGLCCVGSSVGLMLMMVAMGVMSVTWMSVSAILIFKQKCLPAKVAIDVRLALAIIGLGIPDHQRAVCGSRTHANYVTPLSFTQFPLSKRSERCTNADIT